MFGLSYHERRCPGLQYLIRDSGDISRRQPCRLIYKPIIKLLNVYLGTRDLIVFSALTIYPMRPAIFRLQVHPNISSANFQSIINAALNAYEKKAKDSRHLTWRLQASNSSGDILAMNLISQEVPTRDYHVGRTRLSTQLSMSPTRSPKITACSVCWLYLVKALMPDQLVASTRDITRYHLSHEDVTRCSPDFLLWFYTEILTSRTAPITYLW